MNVTNKEANVNETPEQKNAWTQQKSHLLASFKIIENIQGAFSEILNKL